jgi:hypothetical protein
MAGCSMPILLLYLLGKPSPSKLQRNYELFSSGLRIRIRDSIGSVDPDSESGSGSGSWRAKRPTKVEKKKCKSSWFDGLDGLFCELKASSITWTYFMEA